MIIVVLIIIAISSWFIKKKLGKIILFAHYNGKTYKKEISIIPLW